MPPNATSLHLNDTLARTHHLSKEASSTMKSSGGPSDMTPLPDDFVPGEKDVVCSWARQNHRHSGNIRFRKLVEEHAPAYVKAETKYEKTKVIADLIDRIRKDSPDGGFVKRDFYSGRWYEIGIERARDKVGHAIRKAADKLTEQQEQGKQSKGGQAVAAIKKKKTKNTNHPDSSENEGQESAKGSLDLSTTRGRILEYQNVPATLTPGANIVPPAAQYHGIGTSLETQNQQVNLSFPRHHVPESFQFQHHGSLGGFLNAPMSEGHSALRVPSSFHSNNRPLMGGLFSWTNNMLHVSGNESMLGGRLSPANPYVTQPQRRTMISASGSMLPPLQHPDYASYQSGFAGSAVVDTQVFPATTGTGNDSLSAALPIPIAYADQHIPYRRNLPPRSMNESTRDISLMSRSATNRGGPSLLPDSADNWDAQSFHSDHQRHAERISNNHANGERRSNLYDSGSREPFNRYG